MSTQLSTSSTNHEPMSAPPTSQSDSLIVPQSANGLPSPAELPDSVVVIYDGHCKFCTKQVKRLFRWDGGKRVSFVSLHDPFVAQQYPDLTHEMLMEQMYVVDRAGNRYGGAAAFRFLTRKIPLLWIVAPVMHIPFTLPLWQWCYMQVAKRRYKLAKANGEDCEGGTCEIHFGDKK